MATRLSKTQIQALCELTDFKVVLDVPGTLGSYREPTIRRLLRAGLIERWDKDPATYAEANRRRYRFYVLTQSGRDHVRDYRRNEADKLEALLAQ